jgi:hypothetical protein
MEEKKNQKQGQDDVSQKKINVIVVKNVLVNLIVIAVENVHVVIELKKIKIVNQNVEKQKNNVEVRDKMFNKEDDLHVFKKNRYK